ncbi:MAG: TlpA family protein disulfide reductase [Desulfobulbaceae bacterium]|nr:TlpA family protein disulfide reductase [Desulfobulbaceae bacterium]
MKQIITNTYQMRINIVFLAIMLLLAACSKEDESKPGEVLKAEVGKPAPNFTLTDIDGKQWQLSSLRGKVVFINFWATWCPPCQEEIPSMQALYEGMADAPFQMLSILNNDRPDYARMLADKIGFTFPILMDPESTAAAQYGLTGVPETFIIDTQGVLREKFIGPRPWNSREAWMMIGQYLPPKK